ncbi:MAG: ABC transporter substrate-binding protein [Methanospirillum sp.]|nr:ABC transporter substrate-binding protein [Methanospirillum sp.]
MNNYVYRIFLVISLIVSLSCFGSVYAEETTVITDMAGRSVTVPAEIDSVLGTAPPVSEVTYMIAPDTLIGLNFVFNNTKYVPAEYASLPNVGGQQMGNTLNYETFLSMNPDIVLYGFTPGTDANSTIDDLQTHLNPIPVVAVADSTNANNYDPEIAFVGELFDQKQTSEDLITFYQDVYRKVNGTVASIPDEKKKRVYYAEGAEGLKTDPSDSMHAQLINICGGKNVAKVNQIGSGGMSPVSMEQVVSWNPEVIIAGDAQFYKKVLSDPNWKDITAVQNKQVYLIPNQPFGWFDRPPGVNTIIGIPWTAKVLYPDMFADIDLASLTKKFYSEFYHYDLTDDEVSEIITSSGLTI